jgi:hypothetical protein
VVVVVVVVVVTSGSRNDKYYSTTTVIDDLVALQQYWLFTTTKFLPATISKHGTTIIALLSTISTTTSIYQHYSTSTNENGHARPRYRATTATTTGS